MAYASSTDCVGPIAKSIEDIRIVLNVMSGKDGKDQTSYASEEILEDLIVAAVNDAKTKGEKLSQEKMSEISRGLNLPGGMKLPF
jgi:aspartyl-tRNA(Asn)/glutamyl-tRNA(Gln) amidotransferase subunit A